MDEFAKGSDLDDKQHLLRVDAILVEESVGPANAKGLVVNVVTTHLQEDDTS